MQRVTMTIDDELMDSLDAYMRASGHQNRSEAVRDLVRAGLMTQPRIDDGARRCMAALVYVYDHETRQLSKRLMDDHHSHSDLSIAAVHVHVDAESCLEVSLLRGPWGMPFNEVEITYTAGLDPIAEPVKHACAALIRNAQATPALNVRLSKLDQMQLEYFSNSIVDDTVRQLLEHYVARKVG